MIQIIEAAVTAASDIVAEKETALAAAQAALTAGATPTATLDDLQKAVDDAERELAEAKATLEEAEEALEEAKAKAQPAPPPAQPVTVTNTVNAGGSGGGGNGWRGLIAGLAVGALILLALLAFGTGWRWMAGGNTPVQTVAITAPAPSTPTVVTTAGAAGPGTQALAGDEAFTQCSAQNGRCLHYSTDGWGRFLLGTEVKPVCWEAGVSPLNSNPVSCVVLKTTGNAVLASCLPTDPTQSRPATADCPEVVASGARLNGYASN